LNFRSGSYRKYNPAVIFSELKVKISAVLGADPSNDNELLWIHVNTSIVSVIQFCQRVTSKSPDPKSREKFWFHLLDSLMVPQRTVTKDRKQFKGNYIKYLILTLKNHSVLQCIN